MRLLDIIIAVVLLLCCCCSGDPAVRASLDTAERVMEDRPDSALAILDAIDHTRLRVGEETARYALLMSMALDKNYIDTTNDSLISIAVEYFSTDDNLLYRTMSKFYQARVLYNGAQYDKSMLSAVEAEDLSRDIHPLWNARSNELIGDIYHRSNLFGHEIESRKKAIDTYRQSGKDLNALYAGCDLATAYSGNGDYQDALNIIKETERMAEAYDDSILSACVLSTSLPILLYNDRDDEVLQKFRCLESYAHLYPLTSQDYRVAAFSQLNLEDIDKAQDLLSIARSRATTPNEQSLNLLLEKSILQKNGDTDRALAILDSLIVYQNQTLRDIISQSTLDVQKEYFAEKTAKAKIAIERRDNIIWAIAIGMILLSLAAYLIARARIARMNMRLSHVVEDAYDISVQLDCERSNVERLDSMVAGVLNSQFHTINSLCEQYYEEESKVNLRLLYRQVANELEIIRGEDTMRQLVDVVNLRRGNIISRIQDEMPTLSENDKNFLGLLFSGLSIKAIAVILKMTPKGVYTKRQRLYDKIRSCTSIDPGILAQISTTR